MSKSDNSAREDRVREAAQLVTADRVAVWEDDFKVVHLRVDDEEHHDVRVVKAFPISDKAGYVSFLNDKAKEIALLANPEDLDETSRATVERALLVNYFVPKITRVYSVSESWGVSHWQVETDCGRASFEVIDREKIRRLTDGGIIIVDADENRFWIEDPTQLDPRSFNLIQSET